MNAQTAIAGGQTREMNHAKAIREVLALVLERDKTVILMGEDIGVFGGAVAAPG
jgi:pyruvate/2-oxoglutarate/acetoin dehydrogenase E1 component